MELEEDRWKEISALWIQAQTHVLREPRERLIPTALCISHSPLFSCLNWFTSLLLVERGYPSNLAGLSLTRVSSQAGENRDSLLRSFWHIYLVPPAHFYEYFPRFAPSRIGYAFADICISYVSTMHTRVTEFERGKSEKIEREGHSFAFIYNSNLINKTRGECFDLSRGAHSPRLCNNYNRELWAAVFDWIYTRLFCSLFLLDFLDNSVLFPFVCFLSSRAREYLFFSIAARQWEKTLPHFTPRLLPFALIPRTIAAWNDKRDVLKCFSRLIFCDFGERQSSRYLAKSFRIRNANLFRRCVTSFGYQLLRQHRYLITK